MLNYVINATPGTWAECVYTLLQTMCAAGWQVISYSNGSAKNLTPVTNNFPYSSANTGLTASADLNNTRSWFVVQQPPQITTAQVAGGGIGPPWAGTRQFSIQRGTTSTQWRVKYSFSGAYTNPNVTGSVQTVPSQNTSSFFNDEVTIQGGGSDTAPTFATLFAGTEGTSRLEVIADDGSVTGSFSGSVNHTGTLPNPWPYSFLMTTFNNGGQNNSSTGWMMDPLRTGSFPSQELDPFVFVFHAISAGVFQLVTNGVYTEPNVAGSAMTWFRKGATTAQFNGVSCARWTSRQAASGEITIFPDNAGSNAHTNQDDFMPCTYIRGSSVSGLGGYKGIGSLLRICPRDFNSGVVFSLDKSRDRIALGDVIMPWPGNTVLI